MPHMVTEMINLRGSLSTDLKKVGTELKSEIDGIKELMGVLEERMERGIQKQADKSSKIGAVLASISNLLQLLAGGVFETRLCLPATNDQQSAGSTLGTAFDSVHLTKEMPNEEDIAVDQSTRLRDGQQSSPHRNPVSATSSSETGLNALTPLLQAAARASRNVIMTEEDSQAGTHRLSDARSLKNATTSLLAPATFVLETNHLTVMDLWTEWYTGVFGRPSIIVMLDRKLPKSEGQRKLFARRKVIIDEIAKLAKQKTIQESQVAERLEAYRVTHAMSITKLQEDIKQKRAKGESVI
jgi:hypothetical protein